MSTPAPNPSAGGDDGLAAQAASLRTMALALCASPVLLVLLAVAGLASNAEAWAYPDIWIPTVIGLLAVAGLVAAEAIGYSTCPIVPGAPSAQARAVTVVRFRGQMFVRFALTEAVILVGVVLTFLAGGLWPVAIAVVLGWPIMIFEVYPWRRTTEEFAAKLEASGTHNGLAEVLNRSAR